MTQPPETGGFGVGMPATLHLNAFAREIMEAFGEIPYMVGSATRTKKWRDVDIRLLLADDDFDHLFPGHTTPGRTDGLWSLLCAAIAELGKQRTGLPIDFQIQRLSDADALYDGPRHPLGLYHRRGHDSAAEASTPEAAAPSADWPPADLTAAATLQRAHDAVGFLATAGTSAEELMASTPSPGRPLSDELRSAASKLRAHLAEPELTPGPWLSMDHGDRLLYDGPGADDKPPMYVVDEPMSNGANADYIAAMHPGVGHALAKLLEEAASHTEHGSGAPGRPVIDPTIALARIVLGDTER